jgi:hypothetical protein
MVAARSAAKTQVLTTVIRVNGLSPRLWLAQPDHVYVGRRVFLRSGEFRGEVWPNSGLGNPDRLPHGAGIDVRRALIVRFERWAARDRHRMRMLESLCGKVLGCWCGSWDGVTQPRLLCHAAVYADWCNHLIRGEKPWERLLD